MKIIKASSSSSRIDLKIGDRKIAILGWKHLSQKKEDIESIRESLTGAFEAASQKKCTIAAEKLQQLWLSQSKQFSASAGLFEDLKSVNSDFNVDVLGVEHSPETWAQQNMAAESQAVAINYISQQCSLEAQSIIKNIATIVPGPEYLFHASHLTAMAVHPIEDENIRSLATSLIPKLGLLEPLEIQELNPLAKTLYEKLQQGKSYSFAEIDEAVKSQGAEKRDLLRKYLEILKQLIDLNPQRNSKMAENILSSSGNYVIVIGNTHVNDLAKQLLQKCQKGDFKKISAYGLDYSYHPTNAF